MRKSGELESPAKQSDGALGGNALRAIVRDRADMKRDARDAGAPDRTAACAENHRGNPVSGVLPKLAAEKYAFLTQEIVAPSPVRGALLAESLE